MPMDLMVPALHATTSRMANATGKARSLPWMDALAGRSGFTIGAFGEGLAGT